MHFLVFHPSSILYGRQLRAILWVLAILIIVPLTGAGDAINRAVTDRHFRWRACVHPVPFPSDIVVVAVDDLTPTGPTRQEFAAVVEHLRLARVVALDYLFDPKPDESAGDKALAEAARRQGHVILPLYRYNTLRPVSTQTQQETDALLKTFPPSDEEPMAFASVNSLLLQPPFSALQASAAGFGMADINAGTDNIYRVPIMMRRAHPDGVLVPHFSLAIAAAARNRPWSDVLKGAPDDLRLTAAPMPLMDKGGLLLCPFVRRTGTASASLLEVLFGGEPIGTPVPTISFSRIGTLPPETFRDKIVLIGETRTGTSDIRAIATDNGLRGVELTAQIVAHLLRGERWQYVPASVTLGLLGIALLPFYFYSRSSVRYATAASLVTLVALAGVLEGCFWWGHMVPDTAIVISGWVAATLFCGQQRAAEEFRRRERLRDEFSAYVAPEMVDEMLRPENNRWEEPRRENMAILFSDIRNFTAYTETHPPEIVQQQLNEYLAEMTEAVFSRRGFLDKFIGDGVMVLFDPFEPRPNPSAEAVLCALEMLARLDKLNARWALEGLPTFRIGIGIHYGEVLFGNLSSGRRKTLTAIGNPVNLASRMEGATKELNATILVSDVVKRHVESVLAGRVVFEDRGDYIARGRTEPIHLFALVPTADARTHDEE